MKKLKWHKGPPPHVGWWNASWSGASDIWRWWNGHDWSDSVTSNRDVTYAARRAQTLVAPAFASIADIRWTYRWPKNGRVPRINPVTGEVTGRIE